MVKGYLGLFWSRWTETFPDQCYGFWFMLATFDFDGMLLPCTNTNTKVCP